MRQYRGLTKEGKWVYGWYVEINNKSYIVNEAYAPLGIFYYDKPNGERINLISNLLGGLIEVIPETVGQSTGLKDKNGQEIYEGDILRAFDENYVVKFNQTDCSLRVDYGFPDEHNGPAPDWVEVIGNHFENKDLLNDN